MVTTLRFSDSTPSLFSPIAATDDGPSTPRSGARRLMLALVYSALTDATLPCHKPDRALRSPTTHCIHCDALDWLAGADARVTVELACEMLNLDPEYVKSLEPHKARPRDTRYSTSIRYYDPNRRKLLRKMRQYVFKV